MAVEIQRGDIVVCVLQGDYGKARPAVVVQSDLFNATHASIAICPVTSHLVDAPLFRLNLASNQTNGLLKESQIMVDKIGAIKIEKIQQKIGSLTVHEMQSLDNALKLWLNL